MKRKLISTAVLLAMLPASGAFAAALDRSGQPVAPLFQPGNLVEFGYTWISPTVEGTERTAAGTAGRHIPDMGSSYDFPSAAIKYQANDKLSFALLYDHPFGAAAQYSGNNNFTTNAAELQQARMIPLAAQTRAVVTANMKQAGMTDAQIAAALPTVLPGAIQQAAATPQGQGAIQKYTATPDASLGTNVTVTSQSFSLLAAYQPTEQWTVYGGPVYQTIKGDVHLRGSAYSVFNGYDAQFHTTGDWGLLAGAAYQIPDIAFRAALTYRSAITHDVKTTENFAKYQAMGGAAGTDGTTKIKTPQSINLDVQSGIAPNTLAFANLRWVDWSEFAIRPGQFGAIAKDVGPLVGKPNGFDLVSYNKDQYSATVGVGRKFNDKWAGNVSLGWDSGTGEYATTLGPVDGNWNIGAGVQYSPTKNFYVGVGAKYLWLGDAKAQVSSKTGTPNYDGDFSGNDAVAVGVKVGYRF